jgi:hypothetical protein
VHDEALHPEIVARQEHHDVGGHRHDLGIRRDLDLRPDAARGDIGHEPSSFVHPSPNPEFAGRACHQPTNGRRHRRTRHLLGPFSNDPLVVVAPTDARRRFDVLREVTVRRRARRQGDVERPLHTPIESEDGDPRPIRRDHEESLPRTRVEQFETGGVWAWDGHRPAVGSSGVGWKPSERVLRRGGGRKPNQPDALTVFTASPPEHSLLAADQDCPVGEQSPNPSIGLIVA